MVNPGSNTFNKRNSLVYEEIIFSLSSTLIIDLDNDYGCELLYPQMGNLPSDYQIHPLKGLNLRYIYYGQKHFSE